MITICKEFTFDSAHHIPTMPEGHKCRNMHGHSYTASLELKGDPGGQGFFVDYAQIEREWLANVFGEIDHKVLNSVRGLEIPTTEVLAQWIFERLRFSSLGPFLCAVRVAESHTTWAEYRP